MDNTVNYHHTNGQHQKVSQMEMLTFYLTDKQLYGINVFKIIEILECPSKITNMPYAHPSVRGTINFRGKSISVIDMSYFLDMEAIDYKNKICYVIVCEYQKVVQGFLVDSPDTLLSRSWESIKKPTEMVNKTAYLTALTNADNGDMIQILDIEKILVEVIGISDELGEEFINVADSEQLKKYHILVVDDSKAARSMMKTVLEKMGVTFTLMDSASGALQMMEDFAKKGEDIPQMFSMVISDIEMPGMDGYTFCEKIKANSKLSDLYVMLHSSLNDKASVIKAEGAGADDFTPKFEPNIIAKKIMERITGLENISS